MRQLSKELTVADVIVHVKEALTEYAQLGLHNSTALSYGSSVAYQYDAPQKKGSNT